MNTQDQMQTSNGKAGGRRDDQNSKQAQQSHVSDAAKQASEQSGGKSADNQK